MKALSSVVVSGGFDNLGSLDMRFLEEAAKLGRLTVLLWPDEAVEKAAGKPPRFPLAERRYLLESTRFVSETVVFDGETIPAGIPAGCKADIWAERKSDRSDTNRRFCEARGIAYRIIADDDMSGFPAPPVVSSQNKKVVVTGCYDWFHSGHVRFFEEASELGDLYVIVGHDANIRLLKGEGHPLLPEQERRYMAGAIRYVKQALISSGEGWLDADPEIKRLKPDMYVVNDDGDKGGKREYCAVNGIEYVVLSRAPAPGLPRRSSTDLRGF
jgi:cytidyltransferase-like protein